MMRYVIKLNMSYYITIHQNATEKTAVRGEHAEEDSMVMAPLRHSVRKTGILVARTHKR